jgi:hypothetical protein
VNSLTQAGIVVELENHNNDAGNAGGSQGPIFSGQLLANESAWFASEASYFGSNPRLWFGTNNEPSETGANGQADPGALSLWQHSTYGAIRDAGNKNPIMLESNSWGADSVNSGYNPADYSDMSNVIWGVHYYPRITKYSTDEGQILSTLLAIVKGTQNLPSAGGIIMPVFIGEYGPSESDTQAAPNGDQLVNVVQQAVLSGQVAGSSAWAYNGNIPIDNLVDPAGGLTHYGQLVAAYLAQPAEGTSICSTTAVSSSPPGIATSRGSVVVTNGADGPNAATPDTTPPTQVTTAASDGDQAAADAQAHIDAIQQQVGAVQSTQQTLHAGNPPSLQAVGSSLPNPTATQ